MARHTITHADKLFSGNAVMGLANNGLRGIPMDPTLKVTITTPAAGAANSIALSQAVGAGAAFALSGTTAGVLDVARNVVAAWTGTAIITITGKDQYGNPMSEVSPSGTSHTGKKAFKTVTSVTSSASITAATVGTGNALGLPYTLQALYDIDAGPWSVVASTNVATADATPTIAYADVTTPATQSTGDVRGTYTPTVTPDGAHNFVIRYQVIALDTTVHAFGVTQV
jgi:hypothetical protein